jgi:hypothetical protein
VARSTPGNALELDGRSEATGSACRLQCPPALCLKAPYQGSHTVSPMVSELAVAAERPPSLPPVPPEGGRLAPRPTTGRYERSDG